jgi:hypothetical protein
MTAVNVREQNSSSVRTEFDAILLVKFKIVCVIHIQSPKIRAYSNIIHRVHNVYSGRENLLFTVTSKSLTTQRSFRLGQIAVAFLMHQSQVQTMRPCLPLHHLSTTPETPKPRSSQDIACYF